MNIMNWIKFNIYYGKYFTMEEKKIYDGNENGEVEDPQKMRSLGLKMEVMIDIEKIKLLPIERIIGQHFVSFDDHLVVALCNAGIYTYGDIMKLSRDDLLKVPNMGISNLNNLISDLRYLGLPSKHLMKRTT